VLGNLLQRFGALAAAGARSAVRPRRARSRRVAARRPPAALTRSFAPRFRAWATAFLALGAAVVLLYAGMAFSATATTATITRSVDWGDCDVSYVDSKGYPRRGEIDCEGQHPGQKLTVWRFSDDPDDADEPVWFSLSMLTSALVVALPGLVHRWWFRRRRRRWLAELHVGGALAG